jgi:hypothetical protein
MSRTRGLAERSVARREKVEEELRRVVDAVLRAKALRRMSLARVGWART